jgi:hypothetical protein
MLSDRFLRLFGSPAASEPTPAPSAALDLLIGLAREIESDHEEARVCHDEIERLHREAHAATLAARGVWGSMAGQRGPDEHRMTAQRVASFRAEISDIKQEIIRYRGLLVTSLERVLKNCRRIRELSIEYGIMTPTATPAVDAPDVLQVPTGPDHDLPAVAGGGDGSVGSAQRHASRPRRSSRVQLIGECRGPRAQSCRSTRSVSARRLRASDPW